MIDQRFMDDLAKDFVLPTEKPEEDTMLAAGPVTSDVPQTGVRLGRAGVTPQQSAKAGGLDKPLIALLDTLAGAMRGATGAAIGLPGDIRSIVDLINQEGAEAVMGKRMFPTSEEVLQSNTLPQVVPAGAPNAAERQKTVDVAQAVGEFLPAPGLLDVPKVVKGATKAVKATKNMPVGMSTQIVGEGVSELGFYSAAKEAVNSIQQPKGTGEQFLKQIEKTPGVKPEEIKWTGLDDFLKSKKSVTKAEVQEFLDKNRVEIKEVKLESKNPYPYQNANDWENAIRREERFGNFYEAERINAAWEDFELGSSIDSTKFAKYTLPGGENYREILLTLPSKDKFDQAKVDIVRNRQSVSQGTYTIKYDNKEVATFSDEFNIADNYKGLSDEQIMDVAKQIYEKGNEYSGIKPISGGFKSQHFDQPNILAHLRVNDRVDTDGKKVLFVEEVQSDWHQAGRKKGYQGTADKDYTNYINDLTNRYQDEIYQYSVSEGMAEDKAKVLAKKLTDQKAQDPRQLADYFGESDKQMAMNKARVDERSAVPNAPFKTTWHELAMKRAIQLAAEGGYDRVAFTTGKTQAERYDLSKQIGQINARPTPDGKISLEALTPDMGEQVIQTVVKANELDDIVGKEIADKIRTQIEYPKSFDERGKSVELSGLDLKVGGEGMKGFYDQILPKFLDKYAKKWDAKTGMTKIRLATDAEDAADSALLQDLGMDGGGKATASVQYIDVTPKMKESVLTKGQPLFAIGAGGAAVQQEDNK